MSRHFASCIAVLEWLRHSTRASERDDLDLHARPHGQTARAERAARGQRFAENRHVLRVHRGPLADVGEHDRRLDHAVEPRAIPFEHGADVRERLACLRGDAARDEPAVGAGADLAREEQETADLDSFRERQPGDADEGVKNGMLRFGPVHAYTPWLIFRLKCRNATIRLPYDVHPRAGLCPLRKLRKNLMLYQLHEFNRAILNPFVSWSQANAKMFSSPDSWLSKLPEAHRFAAGYELLYRLGKDYEKPEFAIGSVEAHGARVPVVEKCVLAKPFCNLIRFKRYAD